ncbi:MAG TPA: hypothetical protein VGQ36_25460, partial [Thermoanaerobaculia bacterium]|nr:hypothetical protein [Thermoanaerobaculia bacterium]
TNPSPAVLYEYVWMNNHPVAQVEPVTNTTYCTFTDSLGTPLLLTRTDTSTFWRAEHEPYGKVFALRGNDEHQPLRLPGQEAEQFNLGPNGATERSYNIFRWYRAGWGRYTQADPIGPGGAGHFERGGLSRFMPPDVAAREQFLRENSGISHPALLGTSSGSRREPKGLSDATNLYAYAAGSPLMFTDALGLAPCLTMTVTPKADYTWIGPKGQTLKGCQYIGKCGPNNLFSIYNDPDVVPGCKCRDFCLLNIDYATGIPIGPSVCFDTPPSWTWFFPPLLSTK